MKTPQAANYVGIFQSKINWEIEKLQTTFKANILVTE